MRRWGVVDVLYGRRRGGRLGPGMGPKLLSDSQSTSRVMSPRAESGERSRRSSNSGGRDRREKLRPRALTQAVLKLVCDQFLRLRSLV